MIDYQPILLDSLLLDLFQELRKAGMALTLEQYNLLQKAVACGYGLGGWDDIKRICRLLWVKPCDNYDINIFECTFDYYVQQHHHKMPVKSTIEKPQQEEPKNTTTTTSKPPANLPQIPPKRKQRSPSTEKPDKVQIPVGIQTSEGSPRFENTRNNFHFIL